MQAAPEKGVHTGPLGRLDPSLPQVFGRYLLVQRLSRGGMGEIFLAKHGLAGFEKLAVIKKVLPHLAADPGFISRFVDEAQVAIKLQHVNVAQVFEVGRLGEEYFLALEYVEGRDLRRTLGLLAQRKTRMPVDLALFIGRELANGLAYAHRRTANDGSSLNLVHCDISPPNVLVSFEGETKVIDFGIAKSAIRGTATDPKMGFGKFGYMAPEQLIRGGVVDHRTDIYAAGVVLYELLTGLRLYEAGPEPDYKTLARKVARGEHPMPSECDPSLALYDDLVATALRPKSEDRYQSAAELRDSIQQHLVAVNPTISTDQLGSYMRDLFAEEMQAQKELHERVAKTHLSDFHDQLTSQTTSTVSFALGGPIEVQRPRTPTRQQQAHPVPAVPPPNEHRTPPNRNSPAFDTQAPPTVTVRPPSDIGLADGTGTADKLRLDEIDIVDDKPPVSHKRSRLPIYLGGAALLLGGAFAFAMSRGTKEDGATQHTVDPNVRPMVVETGSGSAMPVAKGPTFEPIEPEKTPAPPVVVDPPKHVAEVEPPPRGTPGRPRHPQQGSAHPNRPAQPEKHVDTLTQSVVQNKFMATRRIYLSYREKNGMQLESEWTELATFMQFHPDALEEASRKIDAFRGKLHE